MAVPFGFSVGDFLAVGKLIGQIAIELKENGEVATEYQTLLIELEALDRALARLQTLKPAKHELFQLTSIRATAFACQNPLQEFLDRISKFESRLGTFNVMNNRWKGLHRRMQFRVMFKEDVQKLRAAFGSHVTTINLLLMTQAVASISAAEEDRDRLASGLESKILMHRKLLKDIDGNVITSLERQREIKTQLLHQSSSIQSLGDRVDKTRQQISDQEASIAEILTVANSTQERTKSVLAIATEILSLITSGLMHLHEIASQLQKMFRVCDKFTAEMRTAMFQLKELFLDFQTTLRRIDRTIPVRLYLPIVQLTTALGETLPLPYQLCRQWGTFRELMRVVFRDKPGESRIHMGKYMIMNARTGRMLGERQWQHSVQQDDHLSMSIVLDDLAANTGKCPFPACQASTEGIEITNGGRTCCKCGRWALLTTQRQDIQPDFTCKNARSLANLERAATPPNNEDTESNPMPEIGWIHGTEEDIELYRQIYVQYASPEIQNVQVISRILDRHYGTVTFHPFEPGKDPEEKRVTRDDGDIVQRMHWFARKGENYTGGALKVGQLRKTVKVEPGVDPREACALTVQIFTCETGVPPIYKDESVREVFHGQADLADVSIPQTRIRGIPYYEALFDVEMILSTDSMSFSIVYHEDNGRVKRLPAID